MSKLHVKKLKARPLSWSSLSSWEWDKKEWGKKYLDAIEQPPSPELIFGKAFAESIENGTCKVKDLMSALQKKKEHEFNCMFGNIQLIGYGDAFCDETFKILNEVKTGVKEWDQKRVDQHGQLTMYALQNFIINKIDPKDLLIELYWIPTEKKELENGDFGGFDYSIDYKYPIELKKFTTKRSLQDIIQFGAYIKKTYNEMLKFAEAY